MNSDLSFSPLVFSVLLLVFYSSAVQWLQSGWGSFWWNGPLPILLWAVFSNTVLQLPFDFDWHYLRFPPFQFPCICGSTSIDYFSSWFFKYLSVFQQMMGIAYKISPECFALWSQWTHVLFFLPGTRMRTWAVRFQDKGWVEAESKW